MQNVELLHSLAGLVIRTETVVGVCLLILVIGLWAALHVLLRTSRLRGALAAVVGRIDGIGTPQEFTAEFPRIDDELRSNALLGSSWSRFAAALLPPHASVPYQRTPVDPAEVFGFDAIAGRHLNLRLVQAVPSYLTGIGIFFTFAGLVAGITLGASNLASPDLDRARLALGSLLGGAGLAFSTSMAGLFSSISVSWIEKSAFNRVNTALEIWNIRLRETVPVVSAERLSAEQLIEQERQTLQLERFNTDLAISIATALDARIADRIVPLLERLGGSLDQLQMKQVGLSDEVLRHVGQQISQAMAGAAGEEMRAMRAALEAMTLNLRDAAGAMQRAQQDLLGVASGIIERMDGAFGDSSTRFRKETDESIDRLVERLTTVASDVSSVLKDAGSSVAGGITKASEAAGAQIAGTAVQVHAVLNACEHILHDAQSAVSTFESAVRAATVLTTEMASAHAVMKATIEPLRLVADRMGSVTGSIGAQVQQIGKAAESLQLTSRDLSAMQTVLSSTWSDYQKRFEGVDLALGRSLEQMRGGFDLYAEKIGELNRGLDTHLAKALSDMSTIIGELHDSVEDLQHALSSVPRR